VLLEGLSTDSLAKHGIKWNITVNARVVGPRLGKDVQRVIQAAKSEDYENVDDVIFVGGIEMLPGEVNLEPRAADEARAIAFLSGGGFVILDTELTPELAAEGLSRDLTRAIQDTRKSAGLDVSDRIDLTLYFASKDERLAVEPFLDTIARETLALELVIESPDDVQTYAAQHGRAGSFRSLVGAGQYANQGDVLVELSIHGTGTDV
ncbi:MAG: DUF5915 domain-containing protein, partial [Actinomycetota bacterium]